MKHLANSYFRKTLHLKLSFHLTPVNTRLRFNVYKTSIRRRRRRIDVLQTLKQHRVSTGTSVWQNLQLVTYNI